MAKKLCVSQMIQIQETLFSRNPSRGLRKIKERG